jgi:hypothetical protein
VAKCSVVREDNGYEEMLLKLSLAKPRKNAEGILKTEELFLYEDL